MTNKHINMYIGVAFGLAHNRCRNDVECLTYVDVLLLLLLSAVLLLLLVSALFLLSATDKAANWRRSCSFSRFKPSTSTFFGAPMYRLIYSTALLGRSGSSYKPTRTFVNMSKTPDFSRYFRNSSFFEPSDEGLLLLLVLLMLLLLVLLLLLLLLILWLLWFDDEYDEGWLPELLPPLLLLLLLLLLPESFPECACCENRTRGGNNLVICVGPE